MELTLTKSEVFRSYLELLKPRLSLLVSFSCAFGFILSSSDSVNWLKLTLITLGGFLLSGASVTINQYLEQKEDSLMNRTKGRPLPTGRISPSSALIFAAIVMTASLVILFIAANPLTTWLSLLSMVLYSFVYTPLKKVGPIAVFVGAIPGA